MKLSVAVLFALAACGGKSSSTTTPKETNKGAMGGASYAKAGSAVPAPAPSISSPAANPCEGK